ncbi:MAG TPA: FHA domain-containing protein, partial [Polyangiaceae bacterium]|nr:FHA domain-containing protein [Polyangiaceae bacterium]
MWPVTRSVPRLGKRRFMATVFNSATEERVLLRAYHVFGRNELRADTCVASADVSSLHAVVRWRARAWSIADFSRNGTSVDGEALPPGHWRPLREGQLLRFGSSPRSAWQVCDLSPPSTSLIPVDPQHAALPLTGSQVLPNLEDPALAIFQDAAGGWVVDRDGELRSLAHGDAVHVRGVTYRLMVVERADETAEGADALHCPLHLVFDVSADEEHVRLQLKQGTRSIELGERSHHYCLVTLARHRVEDARSGVAANLQGWRECDELAAMLGIDVAYLNIQIHRARQQLMASAPGAAQLCQLIERRRGGLRLGELSFEIRQGSHLRDRYRPVPASNRQELMARPPIACT